MGCPYETAHDMSGISLHRGKRCVDRSAPNRVIDDVKAFAIGMKDDVLFGCHYHIPGKKGLTSSA